VSKRNYDPDEIDPAILPLVEFLNELEHIETYISCEGHNEEKAFSRWPYVCFWVTHTETEEGDFLFSVEALHELATLAWIVDRSYEDGFQEVPDWDHRSQEPIASISVNSVGSYDISDDCPDQWTPVAFCMRLKNKEGISKLVEALRENWPPRRKSRDTGQHG